MSDSDWPPLPDPIPDDPFDEDGYCEFCGNGRWKAGHAWECAWADAKDAAASPAEGSTRGDGGCWG